MPAEDWIDLTDISYNPVDYTFADPPRFFSMEIPDDNPITIDGVALGRHLFYDPILSRDSTMSCNSCHFLDKAFTDNLAFSTGIDGIAGNRSAMSLVNVGYYTNNLFWDGRSETLEDQALLPVEDPIELHNDWGEVIDRFRSHDKYPTMFRKAFGIENDGQITKELAAKAIAQFERILISGNSKFDKVLNGEAIFTDQELEGLELYFDKNELIPDAECFHCHNEPLMTTNEYINNGLDEATGLSDFEDIGFGAVTNNPGDNGKFRVPSLRNIALTAPYMHDGRFLTLEEVIDHYNSGGKNSPNKNELIHPLNLSEEHKASLLAFLHTLTDTEFINREDISNPFH